MAFQGDAFQNDAFQSGSFPQFLTVGLIDQTAAAFALGVTEYIDLGLIDQTAVIHDPNVSYTITPDLLDQTAVAYTPLVEIEMEFEAPLIDHTAVVFTPVVITSGQRVSQLVVETIFLPTSQQARVSQLVVETIVRYHQPLTIGLIDRTAVAQTPTVVQHSFGDVVIFIV